MKLRDFLLSLVFVLIVLVPSYLGDYRKTKINTAGSGGYKKPAELVPLTIKTYTGKYVKIAGGVILAYIILKVLPDIFLRKKRK